MRSLFLPVAIGFLGVSISVAQTPTLSPSPVPPLPEIGTKVEMPADLQDVVAREFGSDVKINLTFPTPFLIADFNGDGVADLAVVVYAKGLSASNPDYRMIDPYNEYFGYGDPRVTTQFASEDPSRKLAVVVIHGVGPQAWRAEGMKEKFAIVNLPFDALKLQPIRVKKKKNVTAIVAHDHTSVSAVVFWTGKKYRWEPNGSDE